MAVYETTVADAQTLKNEKVASLLHKTLEEEKSGNEILTQLIKESINAKAKAPLG